MHTPPLTRGPLAAAGNGLMRSFTSALSPQPTRWVCSPIVGLPAAGQSGQGRGFPGSWTHSQFLDWLIKLPRSLPEPCPNLLNFWSARNSAIPGDPQIGRMLSPSTSLFISDTPNCSTPTLG